MRFSDSFAGALRIVGASLLLAVTAEDAAAGAFLPLAGAPYGSLRVCDAIAKRVDLNIVLNREAPAFPVSTLFVDRAGFDGLEWGCQFQDYKVLSRGDPIEFAVDASCAAEGSEFRLALRITENVAKGTIILAGAFDRPVEIMSCSLPRALRHDRERANFDRSQPAWKGAR